MNTREKELEKLAALKQTRIQSLLEMTKAVNNNYSQAALLKLFEYTMEGQLTIKKVALFLWNEKWELALDFGCDDKIKKLDIQNEIAKFKVLQKITNYPLDEIKGFDYLLPIVHKKNAIAYLFIGDIELQKLEAMDVKLKFVETIANFIIVSIENKRLFKKQLLQERINKEIELAAQVQAMLIPNDLPKNENIEAAGYYQPHGSIGGDYYDFIEIDDDNVAFCMCDVSGKGIGAGMIMANFQANLRALVNKDYPLEQLVDHLNFKLKQTTKGDKFITMFFGTYNISTRKLTYINAGHNPPVLLSGGDIKLLADGCTILGVFDNLPSIETQSLILDQNAQIIMYTDGLSELENELEEYFDEDKIAQFALNNQDLNLEEFIRVLCNELDRYRGEIEYADDVSILTCRFF